MNAAVAHWHAGREHREAAGPWLASAALWRDVVRRSSPPRGDFSHAKLTRALRELARLAAAAIAVLFASLEAPPVLRRPSADPIPPAALRDPLALERAAHAPPA